MNFINDTMFSKMVEQRMEQTRRKVQQELDFMLFKKFMFGYINGKYYWSGEELK